MSEKQRKQNGPLDVPENNVKRYLRVRFASREACFGLAETKSETSFITKRLLCGMLLGILLVAFGTKFRSPSIEYLGWTTMFAVTGWAVLVGLASGWERQRQKDKRAADQADYNKAIKAGNKMFKDNIYSSADDREAALKVTHNLKKIRGSDLEKFEKAIRKEFFNAGSDDDAI